MNMRTFDYESTIKGSLSVKSVFRGGNTVLSYAILGYFILH